MLRIITRASPARSLFSIATKSTTPITVRNMSSNEDLKINKLFDVSSYTAVVSGGGTGIGLMITQALASNGAKVYITGRREEDLNKVVEKYSTGPGEIVAWVP